MSTWKFPEWQFAGEEQLATIQPLRERLDFGITVALTDYAAWLSGIDPANPALLASSGSFSHFDDDLAEIWESGKGVDSGEVALELNCADRAGDAGEGLAAQERGGRMLLLSALCFFCRDMNRICEDAS